MATIYRADLRPSKLELLGGWLPDQSWYTGAVPPRLVAVGAYRFDDPEGQVGIETHLVRSEDAVLLQVPVTYRDAPLPAGEDRLIGTLEHSVLGRRWVYDACGDPVYVSALAATILGEATQADELVEVDGRREPRRPTVSVRGTRRPGAHAVRIAAAADITLASDTVETVIHAAGEQLVVRRALDPAVGGDDGHVLVGTWDGQPEPALLATLRSR